jgi:hypothetical protein
MQPRFTQGEEAPDFPNGAVPEPMSLALVALGAVVPRAARRRPS